MGNLVTLQFPTFSLGAEESAIPTLRTLLMVDAVSADFTRAKVIDIDGAQLTLAPWPDNADYFALVTIAVADATGLEWRVFRVDNVALTRVRTSSGNWAILVANYTDVSAVNLRTVHTSSGRLIVAETGRLGYRALVISSAEDMTVGRTAAFTFLGMQLAQDIVAGLGLGTRLSSPVALPPANTVAPTNSVTAQIGVQITGTRGTWDNSPTSFSDQWQRSTTGVGSSWADIVGATSLNYTPVDVDFGYFLRRVETAINTGGGAAATSAATANVAEVAAQSLGAELLTNSDFNAWTGDDPVGWALTGESGSDPAVHQVASGETHSGSGTGAANFYNTVTAGNVPHLTQGVVVDGSWHEGDLALSVLTGTMRVFLGSATQIFSYTTSGQKRLLGRASGVQYTLRPSGTPLDATVDSAGVKLLTLNPQLTAPSADMRLDLRYTLPGSPVAGTQLWLLPRISDFAAGNYWAGVLEYTGSQWNITLFSVAAHSRTSRIAATNIGTTNGIRINFNGDSLSLYTTANDFGGVTQRGTTITNSTYSTATAVNALHTSDVTLGTLTYAAAS